MINVLKQTTVTKSYNYSLAEGKVTITIPGHFDKQKTVLKTRPVSIATELSGLESVAIVINMAIFSAICHFPCSRGNGKAEYMLQLRFRTNFVRYYP